MTATHLLETLSNMTVDLICTCNAQLGVSGHG